MMTKMQNDMLEIKRKDLSVFHRKKAQKGGQ